MKAQPARRCVVCRGQAEKSALLRVVHLEQGLVLDREQSMAGRGAYVHASTACLSRIANLKMWAAAFRISAGALNIEQVRKLSLEIAAVPENPAR